MKDIKLDTSKTKSAAEPIRHSRRSPNLSHPVTKVTLSYYQEQKIYDRMYEAEVWKNGKFFGYRSTLNSSWHDSESAREVAAQKYSPRIAQRIAELIDRQEQIVYENESYYEKLDRAEEAREHHKNHAGRKPESWIRRPIGA